MVAITISRKFGIEGDRIARKVANTLGYHFFEQEFIGTILKQVVRAVARHGSVVIQSPSGFAVLESLAEVVHVRLQAHLSVRDAGSMAQQKRL